jgi:hypothetical protein
MTLAQTIVSDVVTLRERLVSAPSSFETYLLTVAERGKYQGILVRSDPVRCLILLLIDNTGRGRCDFQRHWPDRWCESQLDQFGILVSRYC